MKQAAKNAPAKRAKNQNELTPDNSAGKHGFGLRAKLIAILLFACVMTALAVGGTAYWMLLQDFNATVREQAFGHFQEDVRAYIGEYGSWESARRHGSFHEFVMKHRHRADKASSVHGGSALPSAPQRESKNAYPNGSANAAIPFRKPPFHFLLTDPQGRILLAPEGYREGEIAGNDILRGAKPIQLNGKVAVLAAPVGIPQLSEQDQAYLHIMRKALLSGMLVAIVLAVALGLLFGSRFGASVRELTTAIESMRADGELAHQVPVRSRDEMGMLAEAFNRMSSKLAHTHAELMKTTAQVQSQSEKLKELSIRDPLTHLFNRRYFDEHTAQLYQLALRNGKPLCMAMADMDYFKEINDGFSHAVGDEVLRRISGLMQQGTRRSDLVARYGGEEFVIALVDSTEEQAAVRCEELRRSIEQHPWHEIHPQLRVTASIGLCDDMKAGSAEKMLAMADSALYEAKRGGRNRVVGHRTLS